MPVQRRIGAAESVEILFTGRPVLARLANHCLKIHECGIDDGDGMPLGEHQAISGRVTGVFRGPTHGVIHQCSRDKYKAQGGFWKPAASMSTNRQGKGVEPDGFGVNSCFK